jgi:hypothetical protein
MYVRFRTSGAYSCVASAADVTTTLPDEKTRTALLLRSNPVVLTIVNDPEWAHSAAVAYADAYEKVCRGDDVPEHHSFQCFDLAERITYLDTAESLDTEVKLYDGRGHGWDNGFWDAIQQTSQPKDALRLMTNRIQDPDFQVSSTVLESLAIWELRIDSPDAFQSTAPQTYHDAAIDKLRKYVRLLGSSLPKKRSNVLLESARTYRDFADQEDCERHPLIRSEERNRVLTAVGIQP